jgi:hypothetical protein
MPVHYVSHVNNLICLHLFTDTAQKSRTFFESNLKPTCLGLSIDSWRINIWEACFLVQSYHNTVALFFRQSHQAQGRATWGAVGGCNTIFLGGRPGIEGGPNFGIHPPQPETGWHGPDQANKSNARILKAHSHSMSGGSIWASLECHSCFWIAGGWVVTYLVRNDTNPRAIQKQLRPAREKLRYGRKCLRCTCIWWIFY